MRREMQQVTCSIEFYYLDNIYTTKYSIIYLIHKNKQKKTNFSIGNQMLPSYKNVSMAPPLNNGWR